MTITRKKFEEIINQSGLFGSEYGLDLLVRLAHHSSAIEGNTLTLSDTISILVDEMSPSTSKTLREQYEVANHREAIAEVIQSIAQDGALSTKLIKTIQYDLMDHLRDDAGRFKTQQNAILGATFSTAKPSEVPYLMEQWVGNTNYILENLKGKDFTTALAQQHIDFERIHPFSDGNGRTGRMILLFGALKVEKVPAIITVEQRASYLSFLQNNDAEGLGGLISESISFEKKRVKEFQNVQEHDLDFKKKSPKNKFEERVLKAERSEHELGFAPLDKGHAPKL